MKFEIQNVTLKNFLSFGSREQSIDLLPGVNMVLGKDLNTGRSNGSGKSSFFEALPFALYGKTHKEIKKEQIINWKSRKNCEVSLSFIRGDTNYRILRAIKPDNLVIYENETALERPAHVRDYQNILEEITGLSYQTFCNLIHSNINSANKILSMKKPEKRRFIDDVFGVEIYGIISKNAHEKLKSVQAKISEYEIQIQNNVSAKRECSERIEQYESKIKNMPNYNAELKEAKNDLKELKKEFDFDEIYMENLKKEVDAAEKQSLKLVTIREKIKGRQFIVTKKIDSVKRKITKAAESEEQKKKYLKFVKKYGKPSEIIKKIDELKIDIQAIDSDINVHTTEKTEAEIAMRSTQSEYQRLLKKTKSYKKGICPECKRPFDSKEHLEEMQAELEKLKEQQDVCDFEFERCSEILKELKDKRTKKNHEFSTLEKNKHELYQLKEAIKHDYDTDKLEKDEKRYVATNKKLTALFDKIIKTNEKIHKSINSYQTKIDEMQENLNKINSKQAEIDAIQEKIQISEQTKKEYRSLIATENEKQKKLSAANEKLEKGCKTYINITDYLKLIKELCKDENIKQFAISSVMPYLNQQTNYYLSEVGYGFYTVIDKWLDADIKGPGITKASYGSLSGGEARGIDLAIQFALLDIAKVQAGIWPDITIKDEILDSSVDGKGINKLMEIIRTKQSQDNSKIFIISHREELSGGIDADNIYFVEKDQYSEVKIK